MRIVTQSRRRFLQSSAALASLGLFCGCGCGIALPQSPPPKVRRIAHLGDAPDDTQVSVFVEGLRELGYVEGENLVIEHRYARGAYDRFPTLIAELEGQGVECIVCGGLAGCTAAKQANLPIPQVAWLIAYDAVEGGFVQNIARPEGNMTGMAGVSGLQFHTKLLEILKETVPNAARVGVLAHAQLPSIGAILDGVKDAASRLGIQLEIALVQDTDRIESAFAAMSAAGARALLMVISTIFLTSDVRPRIAELALTHQLPSISPDPVFPQAGGLIGYSPNRPDTARRVATYVDKILKGAKPADLPMQRPSTYDLVLNLRTAQALRLTVPQHVLAQATELIQ